MKRFSPWFLLISIIPLVALSCQFSSVPFQGGQAPTPVTIIVTPPAETTLPEKPIDQEYQDTLLTGIYEKVNPGIVSIQVLSDQGASLGSGFVFDKTGHIVTNYHVVEGAKDLEVDFPSGMKVRGNVVGTDLDSDIAVIKINASEDALFPLAMGDSNQLKIGQSVIAIGNPFGLTGTMTLGIISARGRTLDSMRQTQEGGNFVAGGIIQTDAAINPGNSGGPLLNLHGEVIGINRAIRTDTSNSTGEPTNSGIGFAVPVNIVKRVVPVLIEKGSYDYPYLGISYHDEISLLFQEALGLSQSTGVYVVQVVPGGPADKAGLKGGDKPTDIPGMDAGGDLIIAADGKPVLVFGDLLSYLMENKGPGDSLVLTILRDKEKKEVTLTLGKRP
jgi:S1-C subfamily serine protease